MLRAQPLSPVQLFATPWSVAHQAPLSMGTLQARVLEWVAIAFSTPALQAGSLLSEPQRTRATGSLYFVFQKVAL